MWWVDHYTNLTEGSEPESHDATWASQIDSGGLGLRRRGGSDHRGLLVDHSVTSDLWGPRGLCSPPGPSVHGDLQARVLEREATSSFRGSSQPRGQTCLSRTAGGFSTEPPGQPWTAVADSVYEAETDADAEDRRTDAQRGGSGVNWDAAMDMYRPPITWTQQIPGRTEWAAQDSAPRSADLNGKEIQGQGTCVHAQLAQLVPQKPTHHKGKRRRQSCPTLFCPVDCSPPGFSIHGVLQARIPEWVAFPFSRRSSRPRDRTWVSRIAGRSFTLRGTREDWILH